MVLLISKSKGPSIPSLLGTLLYHICSFMQFFVMGFLFFFFNICSFIHIQLRFFDDGFSLLDFIFFPCCEYICLLDLVTNLNVFSLVFSDSCLNRHVQAVSFYDQISTILHAIENYLPNNRLFVLVSILIEMLVFKLSYLESSSQLHFFAYFKQKNSSA